MLLLLLILLAIVPLATWRYARRHAPRHLWMATGIAFGLIVSPLSLGLYSTYFAGPFGFPTGMLGLASTLFHGAPGYELAIWLRLLPSHQVVSGAGNFYVELLNGVIWAFVYGFVGAMVDWQRNRRNTRKLVSNAP
jgi:hypothetical protein